LPRRRMPQGTAMGIGCMRKRCRVTGAPEAIAKRKRFFPRSNVATCKVDYPGHQASLWEVWHSKLMPPASVGPASAPSSAVAVSVIPAEDPADVAPILVASPATPQAVTRPLLASTPDTRPAAKRKTFRWDSLPSGQISGLLKLGFGYLRAPEDMDVDKAANWLRKLRKCHESGWTRLSLAGGSVVLEYLLWLDKQHIDSECCRRTRIQRELNHCFFKDFPKSLNAQVSITSRRLVARWRQASLADKEAVHPVGM